MIDVFSMRQRFALNFVEPRQRVSIIKPFTNKYNWQKIDAWKTFGKNNPTIALNVLHTKEMEKCQSCISKINSSYEKRIILFMIPKEEKQSWHYLLVKTLSTLPRGITSKIVTVFII